MAKRFLLAGAAALALVETAPVARAQDAGSGPSFDCGAAREPLAAVICSSPEAGRRDLAFAQAYQALRHQVGEAGLRDLRREAVEFSKEVVALCGLPAVAGPQFEPRRHVGCVSIAYDAQRRAWLSRLSGPALEEASRPLDEHVALQARLLAAGESGTAGRADGVYGPSTRGAITAWQQSASRPVTGFLGTADARALAGPPPPTGHTRPETAPPPRLGPSFDCAGARSPVAVVICSSPEASRRDLALGQTYYALRHASDEAGRSALRKEAGDFHSALPGRCNLPPAVGPGFAAHPHSDCVARAIDDLRGRWIARLSGPAFEEANRPVGEHVALQQRLRDLGFLPSDAKADGVYGGGTRAGIMDWQRAAYRPVTGFLGAADALALAREGPGAVAAAQKPAPLQQTPEHGPPPPPAPAAAAPQRTAPPLEAAPFPVAQAEGRQAGAPPPPARVPAAMEATSAALALPGHGEVGRPGTPSQAALELAACESWFTAAAVVEPERGFDDRALTYRLARYRLDANVDLTDAREAGRSHATRTRSVPDAAAGVRSRCDQALSAFPRPEAAGERRDAPSPGEGAPILAFGAVSLVAVALVGMLLQRQRRSSPAERTDGADESGSLEKRGAAPRGYVEEALFGWLTRGAFKIRDVDSIAIRRTRAITLPFVVIHCRFDAGWTAEIGRVDRGSLTMAENQYRHAMADWERTPPEHRKSWLRPKQPYEPDFVQWSEGRGRVAGEWTSPLAVSADLRAAGVDPRVEQWAGKLLGNSAPPWSPVPHEGGVEHLRSMGDVELIDAVCPVVDQVSIAAAKAQMRGYWQNLRVASANPHTEDFEWSFSHKVSVSFFLVDYSVGTKSATCLVDGFGGSHVAGEKKRDLRGAVASLFRPVTALAGWLSRKGPNASAEIAADRDAPGPTAPSADVVQRGMASRHR